MKNKKGFTLIEVLAVVVILGLISSVSITALMKKKKASDRNLVVQLEKTLTQVGEDVYVYELIKGGSFITAYNKNKNIYVSLFELKRAGYIKNVKNGEFINPANSSKTCPGYLAIKKTSSGPKYNGYVKCDGIYMTGEDTPNDTSDDFNKARTTGNVKLTTKTN